MSEPAGPTPTPDPEQAVLAESGGDAELAGLQAELLGLQAQGQNGAGWFYWVAALSLVNSLILIAGGGRSFIVGLGITTFANAIAVGIAEEKPEIGVALKVAAFVFSLVVSGVVALLGWLSNKRLIPVFALGMVLYLLDGLLYVLFQQWLSVAFHGFVLFQMWQGLQAYRKLSAILRTQPATG